MLVDTLPVGPLQTNCYLVTCSSTKKAVLVDPGWNDNVIDQAIAARQAQVIFVLNTHAHWDHIAGNHAYVVKTRAELAIHALDVPLLERKGGADLWNIPVHPSPAPTMLLEEGQILEVGNLRLEVLFTPGHTPGHVSFYEASHHRIFDGDVLFRQGIGRTDLPGGSMPQLMNSIKKLMLLPDDVIVHSGHGPETTVGFERQHNPWF